jgi:Tol biopolymer transport system component
MRATLAFALTLTLVGLPRDHRLAPITARSTVSVRNKPSAGPLKTWKLAYVKDDSIWVANGDGSGRKLIVKNGESPCWSPDKKQIAFARRGDIWVAMADGTRPRQLTRRWNWGPAEMKKARGFEDNRDIDISWEPLDNLVTFSHWDRYRVTRSGVKQGDWIEACAILDVPSVNPKNEELEERFSLFSNGARFYPSVNSHPAWSRDGQRLAFVRNGDIWIALRARREGDPAWPWTHRTWRGWGWEITRLAAVASYDAPTWRGSRENHFVTHLSWSPDGKYLVYSKNRINGSGSRSIRLLKITLHGLSIEAGPVSSKLEDGFAPCFSPDGRWIAYEGANKDQWVWGILAQTIDGSKIVPLIEGGEQPAW